jgi:hypothetical protein
MELELIDALAGVLGVVVAILAWLYPRQDNGEVEPSVQRKADTEGIASGQTGKMTFSERYARPLRVLVIFIVTFSAVSVSAQIGYEVGEEPVALLGAAAGLTLGLVAMWAFSRWWKELAVAASVLAAIGVIFLILAGIITLFANIIGLSTTVSEGMCCLGLGILLFIVFIVSPETFRQLTEGPKSK